MLRKAVPGITHRSPLTFASSTLPGADPDITILLRPPSPAVSCPIILPNWYSEPPGNDIVNFFVRSRRNIVRWGHSTCS